MVLLKNIECCSTIYCAVRTFNPFYLQKNHRSKAIKLVLVLVGPRQQSVCHAKCRLHGALSHWEGVATDEQLQQHLQVQTKF